MRVTSSGGSFFPHWQHQVSSRPHPGLEDVEMTRDAGQSTFVDGESIGGDRPQGDLATPCTTPTERVQGMSESSAGSGTRDQNQSQDQDQQHRQSPQGSTISGASFSAIARQIAERAPGLNVVVSDSGGRTEFAAGPDVSAVGQRSPGPFARLKSWWRGTQD